MNIAEITILAIFCFFVGIVFGSATELNRHRTYCDCANCAEWRKGHEEAAKKLDAGDRKE